MGGGTIIEHSSRCEHRARPLFARVPTSWYDQYSSTCLRAPLFRNGVSVCVFVVCVCSWCVHLPPVPHYTPIQHMLHSMPHLISPSRPPFNLPIQPPHSPPSSTPSVRRRLRQPSITHSAKGGTNANQPQTRPQRRSRGPVLHLYDGVLRLCYFLGDAVRVSHTHVFVKWLRCGDMMMLLVCVVSHYGN